MQWFSVSKVELSWRSDGEQQQQKSCPSIKEWSTVEEKVMERDPVKILILLYNLPCESWHSSMDMTSCMQRCGVRRTDIGRSTSPKSSSDWLKLDRFPWSDGIGEMETWLFCLNLEGEQKPFFLYNFSYCPEFWISSHSRQTVIREDVSALHGASFSAAPLRRHCLAEEWLYAG